MGPGGGAPGWKIVMVAEPEPIDAPPVTLVMVRLKVSSGSLTASVSVVTLIDTIGFICGRKTEPERPV